MQRVDTRMIKSSNNALLYNLNLLKQAKTEHVFFKLLATIVVPLIRLLFPNLVRQRENEQTKYPHLQKKVRAEGSAALASLLADLQKNKLLETQHAIPCVEPYRCLDKLLNELLELGHVGIVKKCVEIEDYAESEHLLSCFECSYGRDDKLTSGIIEKQGQNWVCPKCQSTLFQVRLYTTTRTKFKYNSYTNSYSYTFPNSITELVDLYHEYDLDNVQKPWVAWHYLTLAEQSWENLRDYFKKKKLLNEIIAKKRKRWPNWLPTQKAAQTALERDGRLLEKHCFRTEMTAIQKKRCGSDHIIFSEETGKWVLKRAKKVITFKRDRFDNYLNIILSTITGNQPEIDSIPAPSAVKLAIEDEIHLHLLIRWDSEITEILHLHSFHDDVEKPIKNIPREFIASMLNKPGIPIEIQHTDEAKQVIVYLQRAGITGILDELFIAKKTDTSATLRAKSILLANVRPKLLTKLLQHIQKLEFIKWQ